MQTIRMKLEIFQEDDMYVALAPDLNVSSFGDTPENAQASAQEALTAFIEECARMGTLQDVLEEAGFVKTKGGYEPRQPLIETQIALAA
jgi:predicted RNase H-like HicB family nuclease